MREDRDLFIVSPCSSQLTKATATTFALVLRITLPSCFHPPACVVVQCMQHNVALQRYVTGLCVKVAPYGLCFFIFY